MFKDVSIWCVILGLVILMFVHHILSDKPLFEGNENIDGEKPAEEVAGDSTVETVPTIEDATEPVKHSAAEVQRRNRTRRLYGSFTA